MLGRNLTVVKNSVLSWINYLAIYLTSDNLTVYYQITYSNSKLFRFIFEKKLFDKIKSTFYFTEIKVLFQLISSRSHRSERGRKVGEEEDGSVGRVDGRDWRTRSQASAHRRWHARLRRRHWQHGQLPADHPLHWRPVRKVICLFLLFWRELK